ncbi:Uncharacterized protein GBIM_10041 [Gryllus bimaculatus]|nr:Uncharacterized protein GBIM_10041 [Gryllus bimaculatus]
MSESDDTDLLLLIPPDFFVIHSDSEDSLQSFKKNCSDHRFNELISHVNELEERINFIENKDTSYSESLSQANRINQPIDYSLIDASNFHTVHGRDVALRLNSLTFSGFQFGCSDDSSVQYLEPCIMSSLEDKNHPQTVSPVSYFRSQGPEKSDPFENPTRLSQVHSSESSNHLLNSIIPVDNTGSKFIKCVTADESHDPYRFFNHSQPFHFSFLSEIDEFLEKKSKVLSGSLPCNGLPDYQRKEKISRLKVSNENTNSENEYQAFVKLSSTNSVASEKRYFDVDQQEKPLVHMQQQAYNTFFDISGIAESEEMNTKKNREEFHDLKNGANNATKENHSREHLPDHKELNSSKFSENAMYSPSEKFLRENSIYGAMDKSPAPSNEKFLCSSRSPYFNDTQFRRNSVAKHPTSCNGEKDTVHPSLNKNCDHEYEKNQFGYQSDSAQFVDCYSNHFDNSFNSPIHKNEIPLTEGIFPNKNIHFYQISKELDQPRNFAQSGDNSLQSKLECVQSCGNNDGASNLKLCKDKLKNDLITECGHTTNLELPEKSLNPEEYIQKQASQKMGNTRRDNEKYISKSSESNQNCELSNGRGIVSNNQSVKVASKLPYQSMNECLINQTEEKNVVPLNATDGIGKGVPVLADDGYYSSVGTGSSAINFLSLSNLWGQGAKESQKSEVMTIEQKLEEEHYRRKHCENVIQKLQCTVLELQQKLAVAMRVDQSKDNTIHQLQTAWKRLVTHWQELEEQRHAISVRYSEEKEKHQQYVTEMMQKVKQCELELSKALDLAKGYKEKNEIMENKLKDLENVHVEEKQTLQVSLQEKQKHLLEAEEKLKVFQHDIVEVEEKLEAAKKKACEERESAVKYQQEMKNAQQMLGNLENETIVLKEENDALRLRVKEEKSRNSIADQQIKSLKIALDESKKNEKILQGKLKEQANILEKSKSELRDYYQQQVEFVVQEKLAEFQTQLDTAEASLHQEMEEREKVALEAATKQIKHITEKNLLEVKLLEEKHREELHLCNLQVAHATQKINQLQDQLQTYSNRKVEIVEKLHTVMETQWQEALRIISGNSPLTQSFQEQQHEVLRKNISESIPDKDLKRSTSGHCTAVPPLLVPHSSSSSTTDDVPFNKEDQLTYRASSEHPLKYEGDIKSENPDVVKKYIEMLLNRPPGDPLEPEMSCERSGIEETSLTEENTLPKWGNIMILYILVVVFCYNSADEGDRTVSETS